MMARCKEQTGGMFKNPPPTQIPSSAHPQKRNGEEKKIQIYGHVIYTVLTHFLDLNYKHTSIFQHIFYFSTYSVPLDLYKLLLLKTPLVPTVLTQRVAVS